MRGYCLCASIRILVLIGVESPFSNNKMFWYLITRAGLLDEVESDLKNDELLKH